MGRKIVLTGTTLTDLSAPKLAVVDPIESAGSLLLIETMHPTLQWAAGVPATNAVIPNRLKSTLATGDATYLTNNALTGTKGLVERSAKGGLHGIVSQAVALVSGDGVRIFPDAALRAYVFAHLGNSYYLSVWGRLTRANPIPTNYTMDYATAGTTAAGIAVPDPSGWFPISPKTLLGSRTLPNTVGARFGNAAVTGAVMGSSISMDGAGLPTFGAPAGTYNAAVLSSRQNKWTSFVMYRVYLEDLTVSGRTYAEVDAIDYALYTKEVVNVGGRYYGDTFTDPATLA